MNVWLNGEAHDLAQGVTVADLVSQLGFTERRVAVELNRAILPRDEYAVRSLQEGDTIEIVHFVGGG